MISVRNGLRVIPKATLLVLAGLLAHCPAITRAHPQDTITDVAARAETFEAQGRWEAAAAEYRKILKIDPRSLPALNSLGALSVREGKFKEGISYYERALKINPHEFAVNLNLGIAYLKMQDCKSAAPPLEMAAKLEPSNVQALELFAVAAIGQEEHQKAIAPLEKVVELDPRDVGSNYLLIRCYIETGQFENALHGFERLEALDSASPWVRILRGQAYDGMGAYDKALEEFEEAKKQLPNDAIVRFSLGFMCWKLRRLDEAESELQATLKLDPLFTQAKFYLADAYLMDLKPDVALPILKRLVEEEPNDYRTRMDLAKALEKLGQYEQAIQEFQEAIRLDASHSEPHYLLAQTYRKVNRVADFQRELQVAQKMQAERRAGVENLLRASGTRGDPGRSLGLVPPPKEQQPSPPR
jgi:tetratricopeptide (TPR) repeat protein